MDVDSAELYGAGIGNGGVSGELSGEEVSSLAGHIPVKRYPDLADIPTWDALQGSHGACIILFLTENETTGHWICTFDAADGPHVFDPLGVALDAERFHISPEMREELGQTKPLLRRLLKTQDEKPHVSRVDYQQNKPGVNTCGRWVALRLKNRHVPDADFAKAVAAQCVAAHKTPDEWVVQVTNDMPSRYDFLGGSGLAGFGLSGGALRSGLDARLRTLERHGAALHARRLDHFEHAMRTGGSLVARPALHSAPYSTDSAFTSALLRAHY